MAAAGEQQLGYFETKELRALEKGREEGQHQARLASLLQVLQTRFGPLPAQVIAQLEAADLAELERAFTVAITAKHLEDVFPLSQR